MKNYSIDILVDQMNMSHSNLLPEDEKFVWYAS